MYESYVTVCRNSLNQISGVVEPRLYRYRFSLLTAVHVCSSFPSVDHVSADSCAVLRYTIGSISKGNNYSASGKQGRYKTARMCNLIWIFVTRICIKFSSCHICSLVEKVCTSTRRINIFPYVNSEHLTLSKQIPVQTVKIPTRCLIMRNFIRIYTVWHSVMIWNDIHICKQGHVQIQRWKSPLHKLRM